MASEQQWIDRSTDPAACAAASTELYRCELAAPECYLDEEFGSGSVQATAGACGAAYDASDRDCEQQVPTGRDIED